MQPILTDVYNKIAAIQGQTQGIPATIPSTTQIQQIASSVAIPAVAAAIPGALDALIPVVLVSPNSASLTDRNGKTVALIDQAVVYWNIDGSDANLLYQYSTATTTWAYVSGIVSRQQANLATLAAFLGPADTGLLVDVTDYAHVLRWTGTGWAYADPTDPAGRVEMFLVDPNPSIGWQLCDGTANVKYLKSDGTTATYNMPDLVSTTAKAAYAKLGSPAPGAPVAPTAPTFTGNSQTFVTTPAAAFVSGTQVDAFTSPNPYTPSGSVSSTGEPRNIVFRPWFRV